MIEPILSVEETAKAMKVSRHTVRAWYAQGRLKGLKLGRRLMFLEKEIQSFIDRAKK